MALTCDVLAWPIGLVFGEIADDFYEAGESAADNADVA